MINNKEKSLSSPLYCLCILCQKAIPIIKIENNDDITLHFNCSCLPSQDYVSDIEDYMNDLSKIQQANNAEFDKEHYITNLTMNYCSNHSDKYSGDYCIDCNEYSCNDCITIMHKNHNNTNCTNINIDIKEINNELKIGIEQWNTNKKIIEEIIMNLASSNDSHDQKEVKSLTQLLQYKDKINNKIISFALMLINTYNSLPPISNYAMINNLRLLQFNHRIVFVDYIDIKDKIKSIILFLDMNYIIFLEMKNKEDVRKINEGIILVKELKDKRIAIITSSQQLLLYDQNMIKLLGTISGFSSQYLSSNLTELSNGDLIGKCSKTELSIWNLTLLTQKTIKYPDSFGLSQITNDLIISYEWDGFFLFNIEKYQVVTRILIESLIHLPYQLSDKRIMVVIGNDSSNYLHLFDSKTFKQIFEFPKVNNRITCLKQSKDGMLFTGCRNGSISIYDVVELKCVLNIACSNVEIINIIESLNKNIIIIFINNDIAVYIRKHHELFIYHLKRDKYTNSTNVVLQDLRILIYHQKGFIKYLDIINLPSNNVVAK